MISVEKNGTFQNKKGLLYSDDFLKKGIRKMERGRRITNRASIFPFLSDNSNLTRINQNLLNICLEEIIAVFGDPSLINTSEVSKTRSYQSLSSKLRDRFSLRMTLAKCVSPDYIKVWS